MASSRAGASNKGRLWKTSHFLAICVNISFYSLEGSSGSAKWYSETFLHSFCLINFFLCKRATAILFCSSWIIFILLMYCVSRFCFRVDVCGYLSVLPRFISYGPSYTHCCLAYLASARLFLLYMVWRIRKYVTDRALVCCRLKSW